MAEQRNLTRTQTDLKVRQCYLSHEGASAVMSAVFSVVMDSDCSSCSHDSEGFIPSSNFEPPPPVDCILQKSHTIVDVTDDNNFRGSKYATQSDEFEDILFQSANPLVGNISPLNADTFGSDKRFVNPPLSLRDNSAFGSPNSAFSSAQLASSSKISENSENVDPKRLNQLRKLLSPARSSRASVPTTIPINVTQANLLDFRSQVGTKFSSLESLTPISHVTGTNATTSTRTTGSGSDLFKTDSSSGFREPLVPPRRRNVTSTSTNTTNEENDNLPVLSYILSLAIQRIPTHIEQPGHVEFKAPDFVKTITWQSRVRRREESSAASISIAAGVLADSFSDWIRESFLSDSNESHRCCSCTAANLARNKLNSSSSPEYFVPCTVIPESSDLDAQSDTAPAPMDRSIGSKVINPESNSRASTSSSEYFLPLKATSRKRKLSENTTEAQESISNEADVESQSVILSSITVDAQNRTSTPSSEYLIPVKKSALKMAKSANRAVAVIDAVETESQPKPPENSSESVIHLQHQESSVTVEKHPEFDDPSIDSSQKTQEPGTNNLSFQNEVQMAVSNMSEHILRSSPRNRGGRSANLTTGDNQQQMRDSRSVYNLRTPRQVSSSHRDRPYSQDDLTGPQASESITIAAVTYRMTSRVTQTEDFENANDDSSDASTVLCKQEPVSPGGFTELDSSSKNPEPLIPEGIVGVASFSKNSPVNRTEAVKNKSAKIKKATLRDKSSTPKSHTSRGETSNDAQKEKEGGNQTEVATPLSKLRSTSRKPVYATSVEDSLWKLGMFVYAKWWNSNKFFAGKIAKSLSNGKFQIEFEDNSAAEVTARNVILTELLPVGAEVLVDINGTGDFKLGYVVSGHTVGTTPPFYSIKKIESGEVKQVHRSLVAIHLTKLKKLLANEQVFSIIKWPSSGDRLSSTNTNSTLIESPSVVKTMQVSALTKGTRRAKRTTQSRTNSYKRLRKGASTALSTKITKRSVTMFAEKQTSKHQAQSNTLRSGSINREDSQVWLTGRRIVTRASRASILMERRRVSLASPTFKKRRKVSKKIPTPEEPMSAPESPPTIQVSVRRRSSNSRFSLENVKDSSAVDLDMETFREMCQRYDIPIPQPDLFSNWAFVLTTGVQSSHSDLVYLDSTDRIARDLLFISQSSFFLQMMISAGGGRDIGEYWGEISSNGCLVEEDSTTRRHIALIAPAACRTVRYLQALATLGRVPQVHRVWILDACLIAAGRSPIVTPSKVVEKISKMKLKTSDLPMALLQHSSRRLFELPRGIDKIKNTPVPPTIFSQIFAETRTLSPPKTLLEFGGFKSANIVAIITNDSTKFGDGWLSILRYALFSEKSAELPVILSPAESLHQLKKIRISPSSSILGYDLKIVLADQDRIPEPTIAEIRNMGFIVVNKEFMIQSLINGKMLDLKYATAW
nr:tumor suppressor p53 binding protein 1 [Hymenolepis microstoma]